MLRQSHSRDHLVDRGALRPCGDRFPALPQQLAQFLANNHRPTDYLHTGNAVVRLATRRRTDCSRGDLYPQRVGIGGGACVSRRCEQYPFGPARTNRLAHLPAHRGECPLMFALRTPMVGLTRGCARLSTLVATSGVPHSLIAEAEIASHRCTVMLARSEICLASRLMHAPQAAPIQFTRPFGCSWRTIASVW